VSAIIVDPWPNPVDEACIHVRSRFEANRIFERGREGRYAALLSIGDPGSEPWFVEEAADRGLEVLRLDFEDEVSGPGAPDERDVQMITDFLDEVLTGIRDKCVLIHCEMGISRSAAAAVIAWKLLGYDEDEAVDKVLRGRPLASPNQLMLDLSRGYE